MKLTGSRYPLMVFLIALVVMALRGQEATTKELIERFDHLVRNDLFAGFAGNQEALERGMKKCEQVLAEKPDHAEALVWHGSGTLQLANKAFQARDQQKGIQMYMQGRAEMDRAVQLAPNAVGVRVPRGATLLTATRFQPVDERVKQEIRLGLSDYEHVYELQKEYLNEIGTHAKGELLIGMADGYARLGETDKAKPLFERIVAEMQGTVYAKNAGKWLETGKLTAREGGCLGCHTGK